MPVWRIFTMTALGGLLVAVAGSAAATPPDWVFAESSPVCLGGDRVMLMVKTGFNHGTYYVRETRWFALMIDTAAGTAEWHDHGGLTRNTVNQEKPGDPVEITYRPGDAPPLGAAMQQWGMQECIYLDASTLMMTGEAYHYGFSEEGFTVSFHGRTRRVPGAQVWDPSKLAVLEVDYYWPADDTVRALKPYDPSEFQHFNTDERNELWMELHLATHHVVAMTLWEEESAKDVLVAAPSGPMDEAQSWLVNAAGFDAHRKGDLRAAQVYFNEALAIDDGNTVARFNLACVYGLKGDARTAVRQLQQLPATSALREKIAKDTDFDPVREDEAFQAFVEGLPRDQ